MKSTSRTTIEKTTLVIHFIFKMGLQVYYTVDKELQNIDGFEETTGNKTVTTYTVENGKVKKFFDLDLLNEDNSEEYIKDWLSDNGYEEKNIDLVLL